MTLSFAHPWLQVFAGLGLAAAFVLAVLVIATPGADDATAQGLDNMTPVAPEDLAPKGVPQRSSPVNAAAVLPVGEPGHVSWLVLGIVAIASGLGLAWFNSPRRRARRGRHGRFDNRGWGA